MASAPGSDANRPADAADDADRRLHAPATERNRDAILAALPAILPESGLVLEVASGSGQHVVHFAANLPALTWQPTDLSADALSSIAAWQRHADRANMRAPLPLDVEVEPWPLDRADAVFCANMIHISPWSAGTALVRGAGRLLPAGGPLVLYGPFRREGRHTAPSNTAFDESLRSRDPRWGVRDLETVADVAAGAGLYLDRVVEMPANNLIVVFRRSA